MYNLQGGRGQDRERVGEGESIDFTKRILDIITRPKFYPLSHVPRKYQSVMTDVNRIQTRMFSLLVRGYQLLAWLVNCFLDL